MPQKRNPDGLELIRGAAGLLLGDALSFSCVLKGLPSTYNKDLQSDKELLFRSYDRLMDCLTVAIGAIRTMEVSKPSCDYYYFVAENVLSSVIGLLTLLPLVSLMPRMTSLEITKLGPASL